MREGTVANRKSREDKRSPARPGTERKQCGLCGRTRKLTRTECCGNWICDDEDAYVMFSFATNSCHRNHRRYTLCGYHYTEGHKGDWRDCEKCNKSFKTEMYVWYGTNEFNFVKLQNPPAYEPTRCINCNRVIRLSEECFSTKGDGYFCESCTEAMISHQGPKQ